MPVVGVLPPSFLLVKGFFFFLKKKLIIYYVTKGDYLNGLPTG